MQWLVGVLLKSLLDWLSGYIEKFVAAWKKDKANQEAQATQAAQDTKKAEELTPDSSAKEVSNAIDDELSHF